MKLKTNAQSLPRPLRREVSQLETNGILLRLSRDSVRRDRLGYTYRLRRCTSKSRTRAGDAKYRISKPVEEKVIIPEWAGESLPPLLRSVGLLEEHLTLDGLLVASGTPPTHQAES